MLGFRQFIYHILTESKIEDFNHLGLNPHNQEHQEFIDAYNLGRSRKDPNISKNPNQIKSLDQLKKEIGSSYRTEINGESHFQEIQRKNKNKLDDEESFKNGDIQLVHHDPNTKVKVYKVINSKGCAAAGSDKWCVSTRRSDAQGHFEKLDPEGENSYIIHTPEKGNFSRIGIIGVKPFEDVKEENGENNFQDKGNNFISDEDWNKLRKKHKLDSIPHLHGIRGIQNTEVLNKIEKRKNQFTSKIDQRKLTLSDIDHAINNNYMTPDHINHPEFPSNPRILDRIVQFSPRDSNNLYKAILKQKNVTNDIIKQISYNSVNQEIHNIISNHEKADKETKNRSINLLDHIKKYGEIE